MKMVLLLLLRLMLTLTLLLGPSGGSIWNNRIDDMVEEGRDVRRVFDKPAINPPVSPSTYMQF